MRQNPDRFLRIAPLNPNDQIGADSGRDPVIGCVDLLNIA